MNVRTNNKMLFEKAKRFFDVRQHIMKNIGNRDIPLNISNVGNLGYLVVVGKEGGLSLAFYDFTKSKEHYAEIGTAAVHMNPGINQDMLAEALDTATASLEWWDMAAPKDTTPAFMQKG